MKVGEQEYGFVEDDATDTTYTKILVPGTEDGYKAGMLPARSLPNERV